MKPIIIFAAPFALLLAGCEDAADTATTERGGEVAGDVLGGTISDEMLPLDQLRSQSPPVKQATEAARSGSGETASDAPADEAASAEEDAPDSEAPAEDTGE